MPKGLCLNDAAEAPPACPSSAPPPFPPPPLLSTPPPSTQLNELGLERGASCSPKKHEVQVPVTHLWCSDAQMAQISRLYATRQAFSQRYDEKSSAAQAQAQTLLAAHGLDEGSRDQLESRWSVVWSTRWGKGDNKARRSLFQCGCGYDSNARHVTRIDKSSAKPDSSAPRRSPYDFTGCLAHVEITQRLSSGNVSRITGVLEHNAGCDQAVMTRIPAIPIHEHVLEVALHQLKDGASMAAVQARNLQMHSDCVYRDQASVDPLKSNFRYEITASDFNNLYRRHYKDHFGVDIRRAPEQNVDDWLRSDSLRYRPDLARSIFFYHPRTNAQERFKLCISTPEMVEASWRHVHNNQLILDGTFGLSSSRLLVWIAMGVNTEGKGVPVAIFLFSAPTGSKATHAGYNTAILTELLGAWKTWMSYQPSTQGRVFEPAVAITDSDTKERAALLATWPEILLLLCRFHLRQSWTNKRTSLFGKGDEVHIFWKTEIRARMRALEQALLASTEFKAAQALIDLERAHVTLLCAESFAGPKVGGAGLAFLSYLSSTWMSEPLWRSWSQFGRNAAGQRLGIPVSGVVPTTNHLEAFNGVLKHNYLPQWQHARHRLRFDMLIFHLIFNIIPRIYALLRLKHHLKTWKVKRFESAAGGEILQTPSTSSHPPEPDYERHLGAKLLAWFTPDASRDRSANEIMASHRLVVINSGRPYELWATCAPSTISVSAMSEPGYGRYWLTMHCTGSASCTCADWLQRGGACKHLRAFRLLIEWWNQRGLLDRAYEFPSCAANAADWDAKNRSWYGPTYGAAITQPLDRRAFPGGYCEAAPPPTLSPYAMPAQCLMQPALPPPTLELDIPCMETGSDSGGEWPDGDDPANGERTESAALDSPQLKEGSAQESTYNANAQAIEHQTQQRITHEVKQMLPKLHGLANLVGDVSNLRVDEDLLELHGVLETLLYELSCRLAGELTGEPPGGKAEIGDAEGMPGRHAEIGAGSSQLLEALVGEKRTRTAVLPPSPEQKQKRKKSYGFF